MSTLLKTSFYLNVALIALFVFVHAVDGHWTWIYQPADIAAFAIIPTSLMAASFGSRRTYRALLTLSTNTNESKENIKALYMYRNINYAVAIVLCIIHFRIVASNMDQSIMIITQDLALSFIPFIYAIAISEGFAKTAINRLSIQPPRNK